MSRRLQAVIAAFAVVAISLSPAAAVELRPGTWQETETGTEDGKPVPAKTDTSCMTPEEAKDPLKGLSPEKEMKGQCRSYDVRKTATGLSFRMDCGDPKQFSMKIAASFVFVSPTQYTGTMKTEL
ncbi:MAG: DUF3617 family protein [Alphaproteobacteria bacterium]|nr:DUF3617 family protein [Alphaproteobacteria bacterium]